MTFLVESARSGVCLLVSFPDSVCFTLSARWLRCSLMTASAFIFFIPCPSPISGRWNGPHFPGENAEEPGTDSPRSSEAENLGLMLLMQALQRAVKAAICCCPRPGAAVSWVRASIHRLHPQAVSWSSAWRGNPTSPEERWSPAFSSPREADCRFWSHPPTVSLSFSESWLSHSFHRDSRPGPASLLWPVMGSGEV